MAEVLQCSKVKVSLHYAVTRDKLFRMRWHHNNVSLYALILCLGFALLFGQVSKLHMHVEHESLFSSLPEHHGYSIVLHPAYSQQDAIYDAHYQDDSDRPAEIEVSSSSLVKKVESFSPFILLFIWISFCVLPLSRFRHKQVSRIERPPINYLFHPPLRAPPHIASV